MWSTKGAPICPWDSIAVAQTLCIYLICMYEGVWDENSLKKHDVMMALFSPHKWPRFPHFLGQLGWCGVIRFHPYGPWDSIPMAQTLFIHLIWMYEAVWGGYRPHPSCNGIIFTPQVTLDSQILGHLGKFNCKKVHPYALETAHQWLKHFVYI